MFYFEGKVKQNHIFSCSSAEYVNNKLIVELRVSDREQDKAQPHNAIKRGYFGRDLSIKLLKNDLPNRINLLKNTPINPIASPGINPFKKRELATKYKKIIPQDDKYLENPIYMGPSAGELLIVFEETNARKGLKDKKKQRVAALKKIEKEAGMDGKEEKTREQVHDNAKNNNT